MSLTHSELCSLESEEVVISFLMNQSGSDLSNFIEGNIEPDHFQHFHTKPVIKHLYGLMTWNIDPDYYNLWISEDLKDRFRTYTPTEDDYWKAVSNLRTTLNLCYTNDF